MKRWLDEKKNLIFRKLRSKKKEGASLVSVVIGTLFLLAIGLTVITVATKYVVAVIVDRNSTDNFYNAEGILTEVRTGLLEQAGESGKTAYTDVLEKYNSDAKSLKDEFSKEYLSGIAAYFLSTGTYTYDDSDADASKHFDGKLGVDQNCGTGSIDKLKSLTTKADAVTTTSADGNLHFVINKNSSNEYSLTLKNIKIDYKEDPDYASTINTDVVFTVPDYKFEGDSTFDELKNYIVINDDQLKITQAAHSTTFSGNIYTGNEDTGIDIDNTMNVVTFNSSRIISRGSMDIYTGATVDITGSGGSAGDLWLQNLRLKNGASAGSTASTTLTINENSYISNDLDIQDNNSVVNLEGKYYGYSYNKQNDAASTEKADSNYSSAILINGLNTELNAGDGLKKLILAGRAFVEQKDSSNTSVSSNIMTGESMAVKSNQLAYLVPDDYITPNQNPVVTNTSYSVNKDQLLTDLGTYLDSTKPVTENYQQAGDGNFTYLFLNFKDEASANQYFQDYYNTTDTTKTISVKDENGADMDLREQINEKAKSYLVSTDMTNTKFSGNLYLIAGNVVYNYAATGGTSGMQTANYYDSTTQKPKTDLLADGKKMALNYLGFCRTLLASGSTGRDSDIRLNSSDLPLVSDVIIDYSKLSSNIEKWVSAAGKSNVHIMVSNGDYVVGSDDTGLIIVNGNVEVKNADFTGLILANGTVTVNGNCKMTADAVLLNDILEQIKTDPALEEIAKLFRALNGTSTQSATDLEKCISYQNWEKNGY
jgi:hypothetical protein